MSNLFIAGAAILGGERADDRALVRAEPLVDVKVFEAVEHQHPRVVAGFAGQAELGRGHRGNVKE